MNRLVVIAIGGNSLIKDPEHQSVADQYAAICETAGYIVDIIEGGYDTVISHGNGPQVGFILRRSEIAYRHEGLHFVPMVSCVADTQGALGYQIQEALDFLEKGGSRVIITSPHLLKKAMKGEAGTCIYL
jgi:carbamate kinase